MSPNDLIAWALALVGVFLVLVDILGQDDDDDDDDMGWQG